MNHPQWSTAVLDQFPQHQAAYQPRIQATSPHGDSALFLAGDSAPANQVTNMYHTGHLVPRALQSGTNTDAAVNNGFAHGHFQFMQPRDFSASSLADFQACLSQPQNSGISIDARPTCHYSIPPRGHRNIPPSSLGTQQNSSMAFHDHQSYTQYPTHFDGQIHDAQDDLQNDHKLYPSPPNMSNLEQQFAAQDNDTTQDQLEIPELPQENHISETPSPGRSRPIPKPDRDITKNESGRFVCTFVGCTEEVQDFGRKCEWSKHMDKHDRPYRCPAEGCEKLPGFTYSGGLLRHEREVHGKHGGPKKHLNCPHQNCKRASGKGFSRQENLNEHLRRVHTTDVALQNGEETEDDGDEKVGNKRKRGSGRSDSMDLREEMKRLKDENELLRKSSERLAMQTAAMQQQIEQLQNQADARDAINARAQQAPML